VREAGPSTALGLSLRTTSRCFRSGRDGVDQAVHPVENGRLPHAETREASQAGLDLDPAAPLHVANRRAHVLANFLLTIGKAVVRGDVDLAPLRNVSGYLAWT
jgi:hypothetical protein